MYWTCTDTHNNKTTQMNPTRPPSIATFHLAQVGDPL
jgi:hypothetical protein